MSPSMTKLTNVSELTNETIVDLYFRSLGNTEERKNHVLLTPAHGISGASPPTTSVQDVEKDFTCWYGGVITLARTLDPGVELPPTKNMIALITSQFERAKKAIAA